MKKVTNEVIEKLEGYKKLLEKAEEDFQNLHVPTKDKEYLFFNRESIKRYFFRKTNTYHLDCQINALNGSQNPNKYFTDYFEKVNMFHSVVLERFSENSGAVKAELFYSQSKNPQIMIRSKCGSVQVDYIEQEPDAFVSRFLKRINGWLLVYFFAPFAFLIFSNNQTVIEYFHDFWTYLFLSLFAAMLVQIKFIYRSIKNSKPEVYKNIQGNVFNSCDGKGKDYEFGFKQNHPELHTNIISNAIELIFRLGQQFKDSKVNVYFDGLCLSKLYFEKELTTQRTGRPPFTDRLKKHQIDLVARWEKPLMFTLEIPELDTELVFFLNTGSDPKKSV